MGFVLILAVSAAWAALLGVGDVLVADARADETEAP